VARLWYVSREGKVTGPFPEAALAQDLLLGRLDPHTSISVDQENWAAASTFPAFRAMPDPGLAGVEDWAAQRREAARRWADQRSGEDRRDGDDAAGEPGRRTGSDRRHSGTDRHPVEPRQPLSASNNRLAWMLGLGLAALLVLLLVMAYFFGPVNPVRVRIG
jgi:hypothetical protein